MEEENVVLCGKYLTKSSAIIDENNCIVVKLVGHQLIVIKF